MHFFGAYHDHHDQSVSKHWNVTTNIRNAGNVHKGVALHQTNIGMLKPPIRWYSKAARCNFKDGAGIGICNKKSGEGTYEHEGLLPSGNQSWQWDTQYFWMLCPLKPSLETSKPRLIIGGFAWKVCKEDHRTATPTW